MKQSIKKWTLRLSVSGLLLLVLLASFILNPSFLYAHKTIIGNNTIYHNAPIDSIVKIRLQDASEIIKSSELYDANLKYDICLNDGSFYPEFIHSLFDDPFIATFYNKIIFWGVINFKDNYGLDNGHKWNMAQAIAHAQIHCLQFNKLGLWKSNPLAGQPNWKWEGYAEYIARKQSINNNLKTNLYNLVKAEKLQNNNWIEFSDSTGSSILFYKRRLMVQFCAEVKKMNFEQLLEDTATEEIIMTEMMSWYIKETKQIVL